MTFPHRSLRLAALACVVALAACAQLTQVASGDAVVGGKLSVHTDIAWNQFEHNVPVPTWTLDGVTVDTLQFYAGIADGAEIQHAADKQRPLTFHATMQAADIASLYEGLWTRDGSAFTLDKLAPATFVGAKGFRLEYTLVRKIDDVRLKGVAYGAVRDGKLYMINYSAPRLTFFPKNIAKVEALMQSARVVG